MQPRLFLFVLGAAALANSGHTASCQKPYSFEDLTVVYRPAVPENVFSDFEDKSVEERKVSFLCKIGRSGNLTKCKITERVNFDDLVEKNLIRYAETIVVSPKDVEGNSTAGRCVAFTYIFNYDL